MKKGISGRQFKASSARKVRYRVINKPYTIRAKSVPWDQLTRDENGRVVIDEKLTT